MLHERPASCKVSAALNPAIPAPALTMWVCFICSAPGLLQSHRVNCTQTLLVDQALPMPFFLHSFVMLDTTQERDVI
jgi:hypothetical protein